MTADELSPAVNAEAREELSIAALDTLGIRRLRPEQEEAILAIVQGSDTVVIMPTGSGKSAIYQVAAALIPGPTVVVSPLLALQQDQAESLEAANAGEAATLNSSLSEARQKALIESLGNGQIEFVFMAPEQLQKEDVVGALRSAQPSLFVVDEAHCIVEWGHDFRPDYLALRPIVDSLRRPVIVALTATAALPVREELIERLGMREPHLVVAGLDRANIHLAVQRFEDEPSKRTGLLAQVEELPRPGIVYCATRRTAEDVALSLQETGARASAYHAGLRIKERQAIQNRFMAGEIDVLAATKAFGLGIDKTDVRFVIHYDVPESLDALYQEVGRAGRDGEPANTVLLYRPADLHMPQFFAGGGVSHEGISRVLRAVGDGATWTRGSLAEATGLSSRSLGRVVNHLVDVDALSVGARGTIRARRGRQAERLAADSEALQEQRHRLLTSRIEMVRSYAETEACRRQLLLSYFGESIAPCGNCDNCEAGLDPERRDVEAAPERTVVHREWGEGNVLRVESGRAFAFFASAGYRVIDLALAEENDLLKWQESSGGK